MQQSTYYRIHFMLSVVEAKERDRGYGVYET